MILQKMYSDKRKRKGEKILDMNGNVAFVKSKNLPKGCSSPRQICIKCLIAYIHKNDSNYSSKICKTCAST